MTEFMTLKEIAGYQDSDLMVKAMTHGPFSVMGKPFTGTDIIRAVNSYLHTKKTIR